MDDSLLWLHITKNGMITTKGAYDLILSQIPPLTQTSLFAQLWHFNIPQDKMFHMAGC